MNWKLWILVILFIAPQSSFGADFNIVSFGARGDGKTNNSAFIQAAIDSVYSSGGGQVIIPKGDFLTGSIQLKSNVGLYLERGSKLLGSTNSHDYYSTTKKIAWPAMIMADHAENVSISGKGTIDGQGTDLALYVDSLFYAGELDSAYYTFKERRPRADFRPQIIRFVMCKNVRVTDITLQNSSSYVQSYDLCTNVVIDNIRVESVSYWNCDGIDIMDCKNVRITNSYFNSTDDGICLKSYFWKAYPSEDGSVPYCDSIYIANCTVRSSASAVKLGTSSYGGFKNVVIEDIKVFDTYRSAIAIECYETGTLENVLVQNVKAVNTGNAIFIRLGQREYFKDKSPMGGLRNVTIRNVKASIPFEQPDYDYDYRGPALPFFHNVFPASITGIPGYDVEDITLENIKITYPGKGSKGYANLPVYRLDDVPEKVADYPEFSMFGELPAWGFYVRHVNGLTMKNVKVRIHKPDYRPAFVFDDVEDLQLENIKIQGDAKPELIILHNTK